MSRIKELRASFDKKLDALEHQALALEAQLTQTKDQAMQRLEQRKQLLRDLLKQVQADVFETDMRQGLDQIKAGFKKLFE